MKVRTIDDVINGIRRGISSISPELSTFPKFGNLYALLRGVSSAVTELEVGIQDEFNRLRVSRAKGNDLDLLGQDYGLVRFNGTYAQGYVLTTNISGTLLSKGTILSNATKDIQYEVINNAYIQLGSETPIFVKSLVQRSLTNLSAGTLLYSRLHPGATFVVGQYRNTNGTPIGNISGGSDPEEDSSFRTRLLELLTGNYNSLSPLAIQTRLRNNFGTRDIYVRDTLDTPGMFYVYTSFRDQSQRKDLLDLIYRIKPIGVVPSVRTFYKTSIDISITIVVSSYAYISAITNQVDMVTEQYLNSLSIGDGFSVSELNRRLSLIPNTKRVSVTSPIFDIFSNNNMLLTLGDLDKVVIEED